MASISAPRVVADGRLLSPGWVEVARGRVVAVGEGETAADVRLRDGVLIPGLVDLQVNGFFGIDFIDATPEQWDDVARRLPETGVTGFVPTFITAPVEQLAEGLGRARAAMDAQDPAAARILGVHTEGPFLSDRRRGAHNPADWTKGKSEARLFGHNGRLRQQTSP